jgi:hypothetical protein
MQVKKLVSLILIILMATSIFTSIFSISAAEATSPFSSSSTSSLSSVIQFFDHFDGSSVDTSKWVVEENTHTSEYAAYGGTVAVSGSNVILTSEGTSFPWITSVVNPFPTLGGFELEFKFAYTRLTPWGNGLWVIAGPGNPGSSNTIFNLWADIGTTGGVQINMLGNIFYIQNTLSTHTIRIEYINEIYTLFLD